MGGDGSTATEILFSVLKPRKERFPDEGTRTGFAMEGGARLNYAGSGKVFRARRLFPCERFQSNRPSIP